MELQSVTKIILGTSYTKNILYQKRLKNPTSIAVHTPSEQNKNNYWSKQNLIALGSISEVIVCCMNPVREIYKMKRPNLC